MAEGVTVKIVDVRLTGLSGGTVDGGWPGGMKPEEDLNTVVEVVTDEGLVGVGSSMTSLALVEAGVALLRPHLDGTLERARRDLGRCEGGLRANAVLRRRDYAFALFPEEALRPFCSRFLSAE